MIDDGEGCFLLSAFATDFQQIIKLSAAIGYRLCELIRMNGIQNLSHHTHSHSHSHSHSHAFQSPPSMKLLLSISLITSLAALCAAFTPIPLSNHVQFKSSSRTARNMFTGIVEEMGTVVSLEERDDMPLWDGSKGKGTELTVKGGVVLDGAYLG